MKAHWGESLFTKIKMYNNYHGGRTQSKNHEKVLVC
jgi:hypothetical protein